MKENIKQLREETGAGMLDCKKALDETNGDMGKARDILTLSLGSKTNDKSNRETSEGIIAHYIHHNLQVGSVVILKCETDFVAKNDLFKKLAYDLSLQVTAMNPDDVTELLDQNFVQDENLSIRNYISQVKTKIGENIIIDRFVRFKV